MEKDIELCRKYAEIVGFDFMSLNPYRGSFRANFKEYDGDGYFINRIEIEEIRELLTNPGESQKMR